MNIVVLDGHTLNPGDLSWDALQALGDCRIHDRTPPGEVVARAADAEIALTNKTILNAATIQALPRLRYLGVLATGYNVVDIAAARARGIPVTNVPAYGTPSVAQHTFALLLELASQVGAHARSVRAGRWSQSPDFCYWESPLTELHGLTLGIVGLGRIGRAVAELGHAFEMKVLAHVPRLPSELPPFVYLSELDALFEQADVVSLHCPLTPETAGLVNAGRLARMKPTAFLLNTSRGPLIDEPALAEALNAGRLAGAALDVLSVEPPSSSNPVLSARNCIVTPHLAWATRAARARLLRTAVENVRAFQNGQLQNVVN
jgi:glycerate dehydrogenase